MISRDRHKALAAAAVLALATAALFLPTLRHGYVFDDGAHISDNRRVLGGLTAAGVRWAFTTLEGSYWHPLTWLSYMAVGDLFGRGPGPQHAAGLLLHAANAALLLLALAGLTGAVWRSALVAALFALHPLHVEPVAWAAGRKDVLYALFWMLTLLAYAGTARRAGGPARGATAALFALSLMSKPMAVTLPAVLLLLDFWPLGRLSGKPAAAWPLVREKLPLLALAVVAAGLALAGGARERVLVDLGSLPVAARLKLAAVAAVAYPLRALWPHGLAPYYPLPAGGIPAASWLPAAAALAGITALAVRQRARRPWLAAGWAWYLIALAPVVGLLPVGYYALADRYTYLPLVGIFVIAAWGGAELAPVARGARLAVTSAALIALAALAAASHRQTGFWRDPVTLFGRALAVTERNWLAHYGLGEALAEQGRDAEAEEHYRGALAVNPGLKQARNGLGIVLARRGDAEEAIAQFRFALAEDPAYPEALNNLGALLGARGETETAAALFARAAGAPDGYGPAWVNLGFQSELAGDLDSALDHYRRAAALLPDAAEPRIRAGGVLLRLGRRPEAAEACREALRLDPAAAGAADCLREAGP